MMQERFNSIADTAIKWCIYAIVFAAPFSKTISETAITVAIVLWLTRKMLSRDYRVTSTDLNIPLFAMLLTAALSIFDSSYLSLSIRAFFTKMLKFVILYFVIADSLNTKQKFKELFNVILVSVIMIIADGFIQYYLGHDLLHFPSYPSFKARPANDCDGFYRGFPTACFPFPNDLAAWILLVLAPIGCVTIMDLRGKGARYITGFSSLGLLLLLFLTKTRGAWLGLGISVIYIALLKKKAWIIMILILLLIIPYILKMEMARYIFAFGSISDRMDMWDISLRIFKNHPIIGNGLNTFFENFKEYRNDEFKGKRGSYAHNCYLQMACDMGLLGLAAFLWVVFSYFLSIKRNLQRIRDPFYNSILFGMSIGIFAFLIHSFFDTNLYSLNLVTLFWTAIGISQALIRVSSGGADE